MKKYKKIISLLLVILSVLFTFSSCSQKEQPETTAESISNIPESTSTTDIYNNFEDLNSSVTQNSTSAPVKTVKVSIPEGYTLVRISWLLEDKGLCSSKEFIKTAQDCKNWLDFSQYPFLTDMKNTKNVCFYLEGYIFPLTYDIPEGTSVQGIIKILLNGTATRYNSSLLAAVSQSGHNLQEILTIASIIEKEAKTNEQRQLISSVIHNRLKSGMKIQCDPTVKYCTGVIGEIYPEKLDEYKMYYNTYRCNALMPGPICNPGMDSVNAALNPASTNYYYFIIESDPPYNSYFSNTYEEHSAKWNEIQNAQ